MIENLLVELPAKEENPSSHDIDTEAGIAGRAANIKIHSGGVNEQTPLLDQEGNHRPRLQPPSRQKDQQSATSYHSGSDESQSSDTDVETATFEGLNALEIAAIADAKKFLSQKVVQKVVNAIWNGDVVFWDKLSLHAQKRPQIYNPRYVSWLVQFLSKSSEIELNV